MASKEEHHEKKVIGKPSKNDTIGKWTNQIGGSSIVLGLPAQIHRPNRDVTGSYNVEGEKAKGKKSRRHERARERDIIDENEKTEVISTKKSKEKKARVSLGISDTAEEAALAYDRAAIEMRSVDIQTNILKPPPTDPPPTEINFINPPLKEINFINPPSPSSEMIFKKD